MNRDDRLHGDYCAPLTPIPQPPYRPFRWLKRLVVGLAVMGAVLGVVGVVARFVLLTRARARTEGIIAQLDRDDPGWRLERIEAERNVVPEAMNSATPLLAANRLIPKNWPRTASTNPLDVPRPEVAARESLIAPLLEANRPVTLDDERVAALRTELETLAPALIEARKVVDLPEGRYELTYAPDPFATLLPHAQDARNTARLLRLDAILRAHDGDADGALASCRAILNVGRSLGDEPFLIVNLVRAAIETVAIRTIEHVLSVAEPSEPALARVQALLEAEEAGSMLGTALRGERAMLDLAYARNASGEINTLTLSPSLHWLFGEAMITYARGVALEEMGEILTIADAPPSSQIELTRSWERGFSSRAAAGPLEKYSRLLLPAFSAGVESSVTSRARLRTAIVAVAAQRYFHKEGHWPESAQELTPWPLTRVQSDPHTDEPPIWRRSGETLVIYSPGPNLVDDQGSLEHDPQFLPDAPKKPRGNKPYWDDKDIGFRLRDPASRRPGASPSSPPGRD